MILNILMFVYVKHVCFSAQVLLTVAPLTKLFRMSEAQLVSQCPWLPIKVLKVSE